MTSPSSSRSSLTIVNPEPVTINTTQLLIASALYPSKLLPSELTARHIVAIRLNTPVARLVANSEEEIHVDAVIEQTFRFIRLGKAFGQYYKSLNPIQRIYKKDEEHYLALRWWASENMDIMQFRECMRIWFFLEKLISGGPPVQQQVQEEGWRAYEQVPDRVKRALKLDMFEEDDEAIMRNWVEGDQEPIQTDCKEDLFTFL